MCVINSGEKSYEIWYYEDLTTGWSLGSVKDYLLELERNLEKAASGKNSFEDLLRQITQTFD